MERTAESRLAEGRLILEELRTGPWREVKAIMAEVDDLLYDMDHPSSTAQRGHLRWP